MLLGRFPDFRASADTANLPGSARMEACYADPLRTTSNPISCTAGSFGPSAKHATSALAAACPKVWRSILMLVSAGLVLAAKS